MKDSTEVSTIKWDVVERIYAPNYGTQDSVKDETDVSTIGDLHVSLITGV